MLTQKQAAQAADLVIRYHRCDLSIRDHQRKARKYFTERETIFQELVLMLKDPEWKTEYADSQSIESALIKAGSTVSSYVRAAINRAIAAAVMIKQEQKKATQEDAK